MNVCLIDNFKQANGNYARIEKDFKRPSIYLIASINVVTNLNGSEILQFILLCCEANLLMKRQLMSRFGKSNSYSLERHA